MKMIKKFLATSLIAAVGLTAGFAYSLWSSEGTGSGNARVVSAEQIVVTAESGPADLYPGAKDGDVYFSLTNPNAYGVTLTSMRPGSVRSSDVDRCPAEKFLTVAEATSLDLRVDANSTSKTLSIADVVSLSPDAPEACQGVTFTIELVLSGSQQG